jgi:hypothetical protein
MSRIDAGRTITLRYRENDGSGKAVLVVEVSAGDDILPHEHREDMREIAAAILQVPVAALEDVEVELKRTGGDHHHGHDAVAPAAPASSSEPDGPGKLEA